MPAGPILEAVAKRHGTISYGDLATRLGLPPPTGAWSAHPLSSIFETLDQDDAANGRPFRTSVVVHANPENMRPGNGFFEALERLKGVICRNEASKDAAWTAELNAAHRFPWP
jgi:hypothetical protein